MVRLGVFLVPPPEHPFYRAASDLLGYDIWARERRPSSLADDLDPATLARWLEQAPTFGIHCTIAGAALTYDDADMPEIEERLAWIAGRTAPFTLTNGRFFDEFWASPRVLVATFDAPDGALARLHRQVVTMVSPLHTGSAYAAAVPRLPERAREIYARVGEPWALELFSPHWSLMTGTGDLESWMRARDLIASRTGLFADERTRTLPVGAIELVKQGADGYFTVAASFPLTGRP